MTETLRTIEETRARAQALIDTFPKGGGASVIALYGDLGAGKTSFVQGAARALGIDESIISPTYIIEKIYRIPGSKRWQRFVHIDAYRLESEHELRVLGWDDLMADSANIVFVEWADKVEGLLPHDAVRVRLGHSGEGHETERLLDITHA